MLLRPLSLQFYPDTYITLPYSVIEASVALSQILAAPVAAALLQLGGLAGLAGWQWLFLMQGAATLVLAAVLRCYLPDSVATATFLEDEDKLWLQQQLHHSVLQQVHTSGGSSSSKGVVGGSSRADGCSATAALLAGQQRYSHLSSTGAAAGARGRGGGTAAGGVDLEDFSTERERMDGFSDINGNVEMTNSDSAKKGPLHGSSSSSKHKFPDGGHRDTWARHSMELSETLQWGADAEDIAAGAGGRPGALGAVAALKAVLSCRWIWYLMALKALKDMSLDALVYW